MSNWKIIALLSALPFCLPVVSSAQAGDIEDYYRAQYKLHVCASNAEFSEEEEQNLTINIEEEVIDISANSEEIATIFESLHDEYISNVFAFCNPLPN